MALRRMILRSGPPKLRRILAHIYGGATKAVFLRSIRYSVPGFTAALSTGYAVAPSTDYVVDLVTLRRSSNYPLRRTHLETQNKYNNLYNNILRNIQVKSVRAIRRDK